MSHTKVVGKNIFFDEKYKEQEEEKLPDIPKILTLPSVTQKAVQKIMKMDVSLTLPTFPEAEWKLKANKKSPTDNLQTDSILDWYM